MSVVTTSAPSVVAPPQAPTEPSSEVPLEVGDRAPDFTLVDQHGVPVSLSSYAGAKHVLVVFYPFAFSGICTSELQEIRDHLGDFEGDDLAVLTVSCDSLYALRVWADAEAYFFPLLSDFWPHGATARAYGVFSEANGFAGRGTFLVDPDGVIRWTLVVPSGTARSFNGFRETMRALREAPSGRNV